MRSKYTDDDQVVCCICGKSVVRVNVNQVTCGSKKCSQKNCRAVPTYVAVPLQCPICGVSTVVGNKRYKTCGKKECKDEWRKGKKRATARARAKA